MNPNPISSIRNYLPSDVAESSPHLSPLSGQGLPSLMQWRFHSSGPQFCFDFGLLSRGGFRFDHADIQLSQQYRPDINEMLRIGSYRYSFLDLQLQSDVCVRTSDGSLWVIDVHRDSIVTRRSANEWISERIPVFVQYINSLSKHFETCIIAFLGVMEQCRQPTRDICGDRAAWMQFEEYVCHADPHAFDDDDSFWPCVIGDRLEGLP